MFNGKEFASSIPLFIRVIGYPRSFKTFRNSLSLIFLNAEGTNIVHILLADVQGMDVRHVFGW